MIIIFFDSKKIVHKEFVLAGQSVNSAYYCDVIQLPCENVRRLRLELWCEKKWLLHHDNAPSHASSFTGEFFTKGCRLLPTLLFSLYPIEDKIERPPF
jgi:hypothetical protein